MKAIEVYENNEQRYPVLKKHDTLGCVVLFTGTREGTLVSPGTTMLQFGDVSNMWEESEYSVFYGVLELSNK